MNVSTSERPSREETFTGDGGAERRRFLMERLWVITSSRTHAIRAKTDVDYHVDPVLAFLRKTEAVTYLSSMYLQGYMYPESGWFPMPLAEWLVIRGDCNLQDEWIKVMRAEEASIFF